MNKIAAIVSYTFLPGQSGGQKLISGFYEALGKETALHVISTPENDVTLPLAYKLEKKLISNRFRYADIFSFFRLKNYLLKNQIEWLFIEHPYLGWLAWLLKKATGTKLVVHTHNVEYQRFGSMGKWWWCILKIYEGWVLNKADLVFCITEEDRDTFITQLKVASHKCVVVPYGIPQQSLPDDKEQTKQSVCNELHINHTTKLLFFNGVLNYQPNLDALNIILKQINPLLKASNINYKLLIAGKNLPATYQGLTPWNDQHIIYLGFVDDIDRYTKAADVLLNPVQSGGGVKTKMIEALGMNTSVVSTKTGSVGVSEALCGEKLLIVPDNDWKAFADAILKASKNTSNISKEFYSYFNWGTIATNVVTIISK